MSDYLKEKIEDARKAGQQPGRTPTAAHQSSSSATEIALRLLQASSCFRPGAACGSLPCACAQSLVDALSPTPQIAGGDEDLEDFHDEIREAVIQAAEAVRNDDIRAAHRILAQGARRAALSPQAQAGETRETAEAWVWKDGMPAPAQRPTEPVREALEEWVAQGYIDADGDHCGAAAYAPALYVKSVAALKLSSPPAALPAGEVTLNEDQAYHLFLIADTAARNERGKNKAVNHLRELLLPAYRAWHDANPGTAHPALAIPSTDRKCTCGYLHGHADDCPAMSSTDDRSAT